MTIRIDLIRQDTNHPDKCHRHLGRARCEVADRRFETQGPAPIYKLATLLWLHGHGGEEFEVHDDVSPTGRLGGLAMMGRVRNWARLVKGKVTFDRQAEPTTEFAPDEVDLIAQAAGRVSHAVEIDSPAPGNARTAAVSLPGGSGYPRGRDGSPVRVSSAHAPKAA